MSHPTILNDSLGFFIDVDGKLPIYLKDKKGNITPERYPWIRNFLAVNSSEQGYDILCHLKNGKFAKWTVDLSGSKNKRQLLEENSLIEIANEFRLDVNCLLSIPSTKKIQTNHAQPERLIIHCSYHKVATTFFIKILKRIAKEFAWEFQSCKQEELKPETNIFLQHHSKVNLSDLPPYVGSHIIRDPRDMIISGYFYHLWTTEKWCHRKSPKYGNRSYQEALKAASEEEGIAMEMIRLKGAIKNMINWDYANPNFIEVRLEDLAKDEKNVFIKIFEKYGFNHAQIELALSIVEQLSFEKRAGRERGEENRQSHFRKGIPGDWKNYFTSQHKELFRQAYPGALEKLGYEEDDW